MVRPLRGLQVGPFLVQSFQEFHQGSDDAIFINIGALANLVHAIKKGQKGKDNLFSAPCHRWAQSAMDRWIDTDGIDQYYRLILLILSIDTFGLIFDPSVQDFFIFDR